MTAFTNRPKNSDPPGWIRQLLDNPPAAGSGIHAWLYRCACALHTRDNPEESRALLTTAAARCARQVPDREIMDAIRNARNDWKPDGISRGLRTMLPRRPHSPTGNGAPSPPGWPGANWQEIASIARSGARLADLWDASPFHLEQRVEPAAFLEALFPGQPLLCLARAYPHNARTARRQAWGNPAAYAFIVPSPMSALTGKRQDGKPSRRCLDNTGPRRFLVIEFDFKGTGPDELPTPAGALLASLAAEPESRSAPDLCAALLLHLSMQGAPLVLAVHSGGKSVHGWFPTHGAPDDALRPFFAHACRLGADPATWTRCQLVRLPEGTRADGRRQQVFYFNPAALPAA